MVVVNKNKILATCSFVELSKEQLKRVLKVLNDEHGLVEMIVWYDILTASISLLFRENRIMQDLHVTPKLVLVHPSDMSGANGASIYMVIRGKHKDACHPLVMPVFKENHSNALQKAKQTALRLVSKLNASCEQPEGGILFEELDLKSMLQKAEIIQVETVQPQTENIRVGGHQSGPAESSSESVQTKRNQTKRELMRQAAERRLNQVQTVVEVANAEKASSACLLNKLYEGSSTAAGPGNRLQARHLSLVPAIDHAALDIFLANLSGKAVETQKIRKFQEYCIEKVYGSKSLMQCYTQKSWHAYGLQCMQWNATDVYRFASHFGVPIQFFEFLEKKVEINGQWLIRLAANEADFSINSSCPRHADANSLIAHNHEAIRSLRCSSRQQLLFHSALLFELVQWLQRFCEECQQQCGVMRLVQELSGDRQPLVGVMDSRNKTHSEIPRDKVDAVERGNLLLQCGNSAADAQMLATLCTSEGAFERTRNFLQNGNTESNIEALSMFAFHPPPVMNAMSQHPYVKNALYLMRTEYSDWLTQQKRMLSDIITADKQQEEEDCCPLCLLPICKNKSDGLLADNIHDSFDTAVDLVITTSCGHRFHLGCLRKSRQLSSPSCPMCRTSLAPGLTPKGRAKWARSLNRTNTSTSQTSFRSSTGRILHTSTRLQGMGNSTTSPAWGNTRGGGWRRPSNAPAHGRPLF